MLKLCKPSDLEWNEYMKDCERAVNMSDLHLDEYFSNDEQLVN